MNSDATENLPETITDRLLTWHQPGIQRLEISFDTGFGLGSATDGDLQDAGDLVHISDVRVKKDISQISDALHGILSLKGVTYRYNTEAHPDLRLSKRPQIGFLAQDLEQVYPELVKTREDGFKAVNYAQLVPVLVEAIKEQQSMISELQERVNSLQRKSSVDGS